MNQIGINPAALEIKFIHSSGPGGQNVNKVATAAQLRYHLPLSGLGPLALARLRALAQVSREEVLVITASRHRTQARNRDEALERLAELLARAQAPPPRPRRATRPTRGSVERRLTEKKRRAARKLRRAPLRRGEDD